MTGYLRRLQIWETNYGRDCGWIIEQKGKPIAILSDAQFHEMFWDSYKIDVVTDDSDLRQRIASREFWARAEAEGLVYRNRGFGCVAAFAFPALLRIPKTAVFSCAPCTSTSLRRACGMRR